MIKVVNEPLISFNGLHYSVNIEFEGNKYKSFQLKTNSSENSDPAISDPAVYSLESNTVLTVIDSIKSGTGRTNENDLCNNVIVPILSALGVTFQVLKTTSCKSVGEFAQTIDRNYNHIIIVISGDTSISELLNNLPTSDSKARESQLCLLPLPMGTGNAWASSLKLKCPIQTFRGFINKRLSPKIFPLYRAIFPNKKSSVFFIILSLGFHANLLHLCNDRRFTSMGVERFQIASKEIFDNYNLTYQIKIPGIIDGKFSYFAVINTPNLEPYYMPSPSSDPLNSELHVIGYSASLKRDQLLQRIMKGYSNKPGDSLIDDGVTYKPIDGDFEIIVKDDPSKSPKTTFEICCDGQLLNLLDLHSAGASSENKITVKFLKDYSCFNLKVFSPS